MPLFFSKEIKMNIKLIQWDITGNCNLNCKYCREKVTESLPDLGIDEIKLIIDQIEYVKAKMVALAGGEPLMSKNLPELCEYIKGKVDNLALTTNGTLINSKNIGFIKKYFNGVQVSLDGSSPDIHDYYRGKGMFNKALAGIKMLIENGIYTAPRLTIGKENIGDIKNYILLVHSLGLKSAYLRRTIPCGNSANIEPLTSKELHDAFKVAFDTGKELKMHIGSADYFSQLYFDDEERAKADKNLAERPNQILSGCSIGIEAFYLAQDGKVLFCPYLPVYCGDMTKEHIKDIWNCEMFQISRSLRYNKTGKCKECKYLMACGGCPAYVYATTNTITESDNGCYFN